METQTSPLERIPNRTDSESRTIYARIIASTYPWVAARAAANRADRMDAWLNLQERDSFSPIDRCLDELLEMRTGDERTTA